MSVPRVVRIPRLTTRVFEAEKKAPSRPLGTGWSRILLGFLIVLAAGSVLLVLPVANEAGEFTSLPTAVFTAVSALTVTGLVVVDTHEHYSFFGEAVILILIQVGGLGYMLGVTTILWVFGRQIGLRDRHLLRQYYGSPSMSEALSFAKRLAIFAVIAEAVGAVILYALFLVAGGSLVDGLWWSLFHSISAFNNAGFAVSAADLAPYVGEPGILIAISLLVVMGSVGALPILALLQRNRTGKLPLDYLLIYVTTGVLLALGTLFFLVAEWSNPDTLGSVPAAERLPLAFFQSSMPRSGGFNVFDLSHMEDESLFLTIGLMFIGGAAGSTAGGIKLGTFALLFFALVATLRGEERVVAFRRVLPAMIVRQALAVALLGVAAVFVTATALAMVSSEPFIEVLFESVSALGTVGLSTGITQHHGTAARFVLIAAMLVGRFGPLLLVLGMNRQRPPRTVYNHPEHSVRLG